MRGLIGAVMMGWLLVGAGSALAQIKCRDDKGKVTYQTTPCTGTEEKYRMLGEIPKRPVIAPPAAAAPAPADGKTAAKPSDKPPAKPAQ